MQLENIWTFDLSLSNVFLQSLIVCLVRQEQKVPLEQVGNFLDEEFLGEEEGATQSDAVGDLVVVEKHGDVECVSMDHRLGTPMDQIGFQMAKQQLGPINFFGACSLVDMGPSAGSNSMLMTVLVAGVCPQRTVVTVRKSEANC
jgi:hypothetical protein